MNIRKCMAVTIVAMAAAVPAFGSLLVDGNLSDWGVSVADNNLSTFSVNPGVTLLGVPHVEDQSDTAGDSGFLGPEHGGQNYDAEFMAMAYDSGKVFVAIVTGQRPDNGSQRYAPGDIRMVINGVTYGIEVGGGAGGGSGTMISEGASGRTYTLDSHGYTTSSANAAAGQTAGSIWTGVTWINSPLSPTPTQFAINGGSTHIGDAEYRYTRNTQTTQHAVIELAFDASLIGPGNSATITWRPSCANDELSVTGILPVPEPTTVLFLCAGALFMRKRR